MRLPDRIALAGSLAAVAAAVTLGRMPALMPRGPICISVILFHRECPGCGLTRSFAALGRGALADANALNPLGPVLFGVLLLVAATRIAKSAWPQCRWWRAVDVALVAFTAVAIALRAVTFYWT
jgi:hypothetical protein